MSADFRIIDQGSVVGIAPQNAVAHHFLDEHVESEGWQWLGEVIYGDRRPMLQLAQLLIDDGFVVSA